ncbi:MAG: nitroreductase family protein [Clostridia bacterium]|nr:nitroreductase family protein [Clostridia bacterium]
MLKDIILKNRSYRSFNKARKIQQGEILEIIETVRKCPSARNKQPLKYMVCTSDSDCEKLLSLTGFAGALKPLVLPPKGHEPTAYVIICTDNSICPEGTNRFLEVDIGIAAQSFMLLLAEKELGGCMLGAFDQTKISEALNIPEKYIPRLILAIGEPDETVVLEDSEDGDISYYRKEDGIHRVPKRKLEDIII